MFGLLLANDPGRSGIRVRRRIGSRRRLAIESLETRDLLAAGAAADLSAHLDGGHQPPAARVEAVMLDTPRAGSGNHQPGAGRRPSTPQQNPPPSDRRQPVQRDDPARHENRQRANPVRVPFPGAPPLGNTATGTSAGTTGGFLSPAVNAPADLTVNSLPPISFTPPTTTATAGQTPSLAASPLSRLNPLVSISSVSSLSLSASGEGETPQPFSSLPSATGAGVSSSAGQASASSRAVVASFDSPTASDSAPLISNDHVNGNAAPAETNTKTFLAADLPFAWWANDQRQESLASVDAVFADQRYAAATSEGNDPSSPRAWLVSEQMIDIGELYGASIVEGPERLFVRRAAAERPRVAEEAAAGSQVGRLCSPATCLLRFHLDELVFFDQEHDDEEDVESDLLADQPAETDDAEVAFVESPASDDDGMIELSHDNAPPAQVLPVADSAGDATAVAAGPSREHGVYVKTDGGEALYQAFDLGTGPELESVSEGAAPDNLAAAAMVRRADGAE